MVYRSVFLLGARTIVFVMCLDVLNRDGNTRVQGWCLCESRVKDWSMVLVDLSPFFLVYELKKMPRPSPTRCLLPFLLKSPNFLLSNPPCLSILSPLFKMGIRFHL